MATAHNITDQLIANLNNFNIDVDSSKSSDYLTLSKSGDKYGFQLVVRISDHEAMTGRSACAAVQLITTDLFSGTYAGKFLSNVIIDEDFEQMDFEEIEFDTKEERYLHVLNVAIYEINREAKKIWS